MISITTVSKKAEKDLARLEKALATAKPRALKLAAGNIKRQTIAAMRKNGTEITGRFDPMSEIHNLLHGQTPGGILIGSNLWRITAPEVDAVEVDIVDRLQPLAQRWQTGEWPGEYPVDQFPFYMHRRLGRLGVKVPHVGPFAQPPRPIRDPVAANAQENIVHWYLSCLKRVADKSVVAFQKTRERKTARGRSRSRSRGGSTRDYAHVKGRR